MLEQYCQLFDKVSDNINQHFYLLLNYHVVMPTFSPVTWANMYVSSE